MRTNKHIITICAVAVVVAGAAMAGAASQAAEAPKDVKAFQPSLGSAGTEPFSTQPPALGLCADGQTKVRGGILRDRLAANENGLFNRIDPEALARVYATEYDSGYAEPEFGGKYLDTAVALWHATGREKYLANARKVVDSIKANQRSDGYLGTYRRGIEFESFGIWNAQFTIRGLLSYYEATGDREALQRACRGADFLVANFTRQGGPDFLSCNNENIQHSCLLVDMARLYALTGKRSYRDFCRYIVDRWEHSNNLRLVSRAADCLGLGCKKAAEMLICYQGLAEYYGATGEAKYLKAAEAYWESVRATQIGPTGNGSVGECWQPDPRDSLLRQDMNPNENCVAVCWMKLSALLLQYTGNGRYADEIEIGEYQLIAARPCGLVGTSKLVAVSSASMSGSNTGRSAFWVACPPGQLWQASRAKVPNKPFDARNVPAGRVSRQFSYPQSRGFITLTPIKPMTTSWESVSNVTLFSATPVRSFQP